MLRRNMPRLFVRVIILTTLVSALFFTSPDVTRNTVHANDPINDPFCTVCQGYYEECVASCPPLGEGRIACRGACTLAQRECEIDLCYCWPYVDC
jgi:hypothetical protein